MTGPSIVVPPAMPQRSLVPRMPHSTPNTGRNSHQGAKSVKGPNATANRAKTASAPARRECIAATPRRVCSTSSCTNVLEQSWPWKQCRQCARGARGAKAREVRKAANPYACVDVACVACFASSAVPVNELKAGQLYLCGPCRERNAALSTALMQAPTLSPSHPLAPPRTIVMHDASAPPKHDASSLGHGPPPASQLPFPNQSMFVRTPLLPPQGQFLPMSVPSDASTSTGSGPFDAIMRFVHPDHRHILGQGGGLVPPPPSQVAPAHAPASQLAVAPARPTTPPAVKRVRLTAPHYSSTGAILAVLSKDLGMKRSSLPSAKVSEPLPTPDRAAETENIAGSSSASLAQSEPHHLETPRKVSVTHAQNGSIKLKIPPKNTPPAIAQAPIPTPSDKSPRGPSENAVTSSSSSSSAFAPASQRKKRKRAQKAAIRVCDSPGCENAIPPRFKGARCVQCGFARWSTVFRERFDGIRAELVQAGIAGPAQAVKEKKKEEARVIEKQPAPEDTPSSATGPSRKQAPFAAHNNALQQPSSVLHSEIPPPSVFRKPSIKSVKLIVSPRHSQPADGVNPSDPRPSSSHTETLPSAAAEISKPKIKSIKLRLSAPPSSHTPPIDIPATHTDDTPQLTPAILADVDVVEAERRYPMDVDHDREASDGDMTDSEASIPLAYRSAATDTKTTHQHSVPGAAEADAEYPTYFDHGLEDHAGDTTESEVSVPLADWAPSLLPSTTPRSGSSLPPVRRVRLILGPNPVRAISSRESSPELALSSSRPFSVRRRWEALGWDTDESDLTPLEDSADEGESEIDLPESSDEEGEDDGDDGAGPGTRLSIVVPRRTESPPEKHRWQCATAQCANVLAYGSHFKKCDACRKRIHLRRKQEATPGRVGGAVPSRYADSEFYIPPDADLTGYRRCSHARCNHLIPPASQYCYRMCGPCRARGRRRRWKRKGLEPPPEDASARNHTSASIMERAIANAVRTAAKEQGPATGKRKRQAVDGARGEAPSGEKLMEMPPYQHFVALLDALRARFSQFKAVQTRYVQLKALTGADSKPMVFGFDGEYSVVTDPSGGSVDAVVNTVIRNVQAALDLRFQPAGVNSGPEDSVIASLSGAYVTQIPRLSNKPVANTTDGSTSLAEISSEADSAANAPVEVTMAGELHICVAWDRRHKFFPGQRVMLRFRLVG